MGLAEAQALLAGLVTDKRLRERFFRDPIAVGESSGLDEGQAATLAGLDRSGVEAFADSLDRKRRDELAKVLPITVQALADEYATAFRHFADEHPQRGRSGHMGDAQAFAEFLANRTDTVPWRGDLARYEWAFRDLANTPRLFSIARFRFSVQRVVNLVLQGRTLPPIRPSLTIALWYRIGPSGRLRHFAVSPFAGKMEASTTSDSPASP